MSRGGIHRIAGNERHRSTLVPTTRLGKWALGSVTATVAIAVAVVTVVPGDSLAAFVIGFAVLGGVLAGGALTFAAILLRGERALSVYAAALVLCGGVLFVLLHSLFISD